MDTWLTGARDQLASTASIAPTELELREEDVRTLLDLARIAALESGERTNAPLLCYLVGLTVGRTSAPLDEVADSVRQAPP